MIMNRKNILFIAASIMAASCTNDIASSVNPSDEEAGISTYVRFRGFVDANSDISTRATVEKDGYRHIGSFWQAGDAIGIFPYSPVANSQLKYTMTNFYTYAEMHEPTADNSHGIAFTENSPMGQDAAGHVAGNLNQTSDHQDKNCIAKFDGEGFGLIDGETYLAYYPYDETSDGHDQQNFCKHIPNIRFDGQKQYGNDNVSYLSNYLYLYGEPAAPINGSIPIWMNPATAILKVTFDGVPKGHKFTQAQVYVEMQDEATDSLFYKEATMDITDWGKMAAKRNSEGKFDKSNQYLTVDLYDEQGNRGMEPYGEESWEDDWYLLSIYMMVPPTYIGDRDIKFSAYDATDNVYYTFTIENNSLLFMNKGVALGGVNWNPNVEPIAGFCAGVVYSSQTYVEKEYEPLKTTTVEWHPVLPGYYAWGETVPEGEADVSNVNNSLYNNHVYGDLDDDTKKDFCWETYKWVKATGEYPNAQDNISKYQIDDDGQFAGHENSWYERDDVNRSWTFKGDGLDRLRAEDDAARAQLGGEWRIPTEAEFEELRNECTWTWVEEDSKYLLPGYEVTDKQGHTLFLPAAGAKRYEKSSGKNEFLPAWQYKVAGAYWTANLSISTLSAQSFTFTNGRIEGGSPFRYYGLGIVPVRSIKGNESLSYEGYATWKKKRQ